MTHEDAIIRRQRRPVAQARLRMAGRGITRWIEPKPEEPAHGFLVRLARRHHVDSVREFAANLGIDAIEDVEACLSALSRSRFATPEHIASLRRWTADVHGLATRRFASGRGDRLQSFVSLGGQTVRRDDWTLATRRFCPACLAEDPYHRAWFDLAFVRTCPIHGVDLTDVAPDGTSVGWKRSSLDVTNLHGRLAKASPRLDGPPPTLEAYVLGRMGVIPAAAHDLLDARPVHEVVEAAEMMAASRSVASGSRCR